MLLIWNRLRRRARKTETQDVSEGEEEEESSEEEIGEITMELIEKLEARTGTRR